MRDERPASFDEYVAWYLDREYRKGNRLGQCGDVAAMQAEMARAHGGKLRDWFARGTWRAVLLDTPDDMFRLVCVDSDETRRQRLLGAPGQADRRTLSTVVDCAYRTGYFRCSELLLNNPGEYAKREGNIRAFRRRAPEFAGTERIVVCSLNAGERDENRSGTYYLHDGFGRMLAYGYLVRYEGLPFRPVEALLAREPA